jgi:large subunit ribosomal protein L35
MKQKLKTHKGAAKRFKKTGSGKIVRRHAFARHILTKKATGRKRKLGKSTLVDEADVKAVRSMLPYA